jgi:hypothetical protein
MDAATVIRAANNIHHEHPPSTTVHPQEELTLATLPRYLAAHFDSLKN